MRAPIHSPVRIIYFALGVAWLGSHLTADTLDDRVSALMKKRDIPGLSLAVFKDGEIIKAQGYGVAAEGENIPVTADTLFQAGSISKAVTAFGALHLVEAGKLSLDADVNGFLKTWRVPENEFTRISKVTLRRLLSHSAGITVHGFPGYAVDEPRPTLVQVLNGEKPANTPPIRVNIAPGSIYRYSGGGVTIVQQLIIDAARAPFPDFMYREVLEPLGMHASSYEQPLPAARAALAASGQSVAGRWHVYPEMAAAGLWTTPSDLARFAITLQASAAGRPNSVISPASALQILTRQKGDAGLGIFLYGRGATERFGHGGRDEGFDAELVAYRNFANGAVVMINANDDSGVISRVLESIADAYGWPNYPHKQAPRPIEDLHPKLTEKMKTILDEIRGETLDRAFSAEVADDLRPQLKTLATGMKRYGHLESIALIGANNRGKSFRLSLLYNLRK